MNLVGYAELLAWTLLVECLVAAALASHGRRGHTVATMAFANLLTHPIATWLALQTAAFWSLEIVVTLAEFGLLQAVGRLAPGRAAVLAVVANAATVVIAVVCW